MQTSRYTIATLQNRIAALERKLRAIEIQNLDGRLDAIETVISVAPPVFDPPSGETHVRAAPLFVASPSATELGVYYPSWIDWPGAWHNGSNTAYASFATNMYNMFQTGLLSPTQQLIKRVYFGFAAPNPTLGPQVVNFGPPDSKGVQAPITASGYPFFFPPGGAPTNPLPGTSFYAPTLNDTVLSWIQQLKLDMAGNGAGHAPVYDWTKVLPPGFLPTFVLSVGGWSYSRDPPKGTRNYFKDFSAELYDSWATAAIAFAQQWGFDGIDLDYELDAVAFPYSSTSILTNMVNALATHIPAGYETVFKDLLSVTVQGHYYTVGGALAPFCTSQWVRVINAMVYDSGCLTRYEPRDFAEQFAAGCTGPSAQILPAIAPSKLGFGLEIVPQAIAPQPPQGILPYTMDLLVAQTLAAYAANRAGAAFKEIFIWMYSPPDLPPATFASYIENIAAGMYGSGMPGYDSLASSGSAAEFYYFITNSTYSLGVQHVLTNMSWSPADPAPPPFHPPT